jgi:predicted peptidase
VYRDRQGREHRYMVFVPWNYDRSRPHPAILFLHGAGEIGTDGSLPTTAGFGPAIREREESFPFFAVFPQSERGGWLAGHAEASRALNILAAVTTEFNLDPDRIHLTGVSMGGYGVWSLAIEYPGKWASIVPVSGGGTPALAWKIAGVPCWCFHGADDEIIPVQESREMVEAVRAAGGDPIYTEYAAVPHNCWDLAYRTGELYVWMTAQTLRRAKARSHQAPM